MNIYGPDNELEGETAKMHILASTSGTISLQDETNFKEFMILSELGSEEQTADAIADITASADGHEYWLYAESIFNLSPLKDDLQWVADFWKMLKTVEKYGFFDSEKKLVKAHVRSKN